MNHRFLARIILETITPLQVGSGEKNILTDQLVALDVNQLPNIPGTSLAGVLRNNLSSSLQEEEINTIFGFQGNKEEESEGSRLILSSANLIGSEGLVLDGLKIIDFSDSFYKWFKDLPVRQHVRISEKGAAEKSGKFDNQVVFAGSRFCFEMEMVSDGSAKDKNLWEKLIGELHTSIFRLGGGTRKGYGEVNVVEIKQTTLDLTKKLDAYLKKTSNLNDSFWSAIIPDTLDKATSGTMTSYRLELIPDDFFLFSSGLESSDADITYVSEPIVIWQNGKPAFSDKKILIPGSSVKGAISHRVAFHYNKIKGIFADQLTKEIRTTDNNAVRALFGYSADGEDGMRGKLILSDLYLNDNMIVKLLNHVSIDRFTGGAIAGALFSEEVIFNHGQSFNLEFLIEAGAFSEPDIEKAFMATMMDLCTGLLPLGGGTMRGHGSFSGKLFINEEEIKLW